MSMNRDAESSMSSLSAGLSAYNAGEPKPMASTNNSVRSKQSSRQSGGRSQQGGYGPGPPSQHPGDGQSYRSQPHSVDGHSAQSVASALSQGTAGRGHNHRMDGDDRSARSSNTERLMGVVNELTGHPPHDGQLDGGRGDGYGGYQDDGMSRGSRRSGHTNGSRSRRSVDPDVNSRTGYSSRDPDEASRSVRSGAPPPPPPRSSSSRGSRRSNAPGYEPDGMSHEFGADDPDGRHYAPGINNHNNGNNNNSRAVPPPVGMQGQGPPSVASSRQSRQSSKQSSYRDNGGGEDEASYYSEQSKQSRASRGNYGNDQGEDEGSIPEEGSYYTRDSRNSRGEDGSTVRSNGGHPDINAEIMSYRSQDEGTYMSRGNESRSSRGSSHRSGKVSKKGKPMLKKEVDNNKRAMWWYNFSRCVTFAVPDKCIRKDDVEAKQAWREKVAICFIVFLASTFFVGIFGFIPVMLCRERTVYTLTNVQERTSEEWVVLHGYVYDVGGLFERHPTGPAGIEAFLNDDASRMFPRTPVAMLPDMCLNKDKLVGNEELQSTQPECKDFTAEDKKNGLPCHNFVTGINATNKYMGEFEKGVLAHDGSVLLDSPFTFWVSIHDRVYNVTEYVNDIRNQQTKQIEKDHPMAYLEPTLNNLVINKLNEDATELFLSVYPDDRVLACMDELFYVGIIDTRFDVVCFVLNILMYFGLIFIALIMIMQMICSLMYVAKGTRTYTDEDTQDQVIIMVPCYSENGAELIKTFDSLLSTTYPEENKVIFVIADGIVTGNGQDMSTPEHVAEILGFEMEPENDELYAYDSIGLLTDNRARVYHGYYEVEDKTAKYVVVIKHGLPMEQTGSAKPGNRGKRDSQLIMMGYFNRIYHGRELSELDAAIEDALIDLNMQSDDMRLLMTIDADTRVDEMSVTHMTYAMNQNEKILALCGETKVDNKWQTWVTMMQVFEYYNNHHMKKGFESAFGCVTCLPGCFTMYRILNDDGKPLLADDHVYAEYLRNDIDSLHEQNLFHLGEDRMLTTLLLHFFPDMFLSYVPEAQCFTIVPHTMRILLSQRRRWINSTYHNLLELTKVKTMCGVCCFSMKTVVYLDLTACMILPASTVYAAYLIFLVAAGQTQFSILLLVLYGLIIGVQIVVFIVRSRYDFLFWFIYFTIIGVPVFYFVLPLYAFWHMDDFSWGETRKVAAMKSTYEKPPAQETIQEDDDYDSTSSSDDESEEYSRRSKK
mmetsp:Transcript_20947/g.50453  ORF Transcript_20947/g.50453 Transcript_20947/m.50453 type:complete len:1222 (+) Transcript_20947:51-3716(+)|eukprot:CAMPEP_0181127544 /NCGR_PEP_ID=MMETSP1071-20121207/28258_1 /TAXON_ID=35127 /ORGANISM="Thalassiosira sp., Strain NH16" /LENGTH=1221 /DNA_ID=CAMNT_0023213297 /DNA_START=47 /DNA_END=3712 /DNA_ORIENTATION=-